MVTVDSEAQGFPVLLVLKDDPYSQDKHSLSYMSNLKKCVLDFYRRLQCSFHKYEIRGIYSQGKV